MKLATNLAVLLIIFYSQFLIFNQANSQTIGPINRQNGTFKVNGNLITKYDAIELLKSDESAINRFNGGKTLSWVGAGVSFGSLIWLSVNAANSVDDIFSGNTNIQKVNTSILVPTIAIVGGIGVIVGGFVRKKSAWDIYNHKFSPTSKGLSINFNPSQVSLKYNF